MVAERYIKRTVWEAKCDCGVTVVKENNAPRARRCDCGKWVDYVEKSAIGPDLNLPGYKPSMY